MFQIDRRERRRL